MESHKAQTISETINHWSSVRGLDKPQMASGQFKWQRNCNCLKCVNPSGMWSVSEPDLKIQDVGRRYNGIREANEI